MHEMKCANGDKKEGKNERLFYKQKEGKNGAIIL